LRVIDQTCPGCNAPLDHTARNCAYCARPIVITSFSTLHECTPQQASNYMRMYQGMETEGVLDADGRSALAMCYLKVGLFDKALREFDFALDSNPANSETYFYAAVSQLGGKRPFLCQRTQVDQAGQYATAATRIEPRAPYFAFLALLSRDFYERKFLRPATSSHEYMAIAAELGVTQADYHLLSEVLQFQDLQEYLQETKTQ
jgi:tetratricopeptide (TPR) repeat protein